MEIMGTGAHSVFSFRDSWRFTKDGKRIPINELMECTKEECEYNKDGKCWNSNYSYECKYRVKKGE